MSVETSLHSAPLYQNKGLSITRFVIFALIILIPVKAGRLVEASVVYSKQ